MKKKSFFKAVAAALAVATIGSATFACERSAATKTARRS